MKGIIIAAVAVCLALIGVGVYYTVRPSAPLPRAVPLSAGYQAHLDLQGWLLGSSSAKVRLEEYADFQCPGCAELSPVVGQLAAKYGNKIQIIYRYYPLTQIHDKALLAAEAAEAAGRQGKFWPMHDKLFTGQGDWRNLDPASFRTTVVGYASDLGLNLDQFKQDLDDPTTQDPINVDLNRAQQLSLDGTPSFLINGTLLTEPNNQLETADDLDKAIQQALTNAGVK